MAQTPAGPESKQDYASFRPSGALTAAIVGVVDFCCRRAWLVVVASILLSIGCGVFAAHRFAINTDINQLISPHLPWRQRQLDDQCANLARLHLPVVGVDNTHVHAGYGFAW